MRIRDTSATHVRVPLETPYLISRGRVDAFDSVIVRLTTDDGHVGYGESVPLSVVGDAGSMARMINGPIAALLVGVDPFDIERVVAQAAAIVGPNIDVLAGVDLALWDLMGKAVGQPAYKLMGGRCQDLIRVDFTIGADTPERMAETARAVCAAGFQGVVVKVTTASVEADVARVRAVRDVLPPACSVRVDCNAGFARNDAMMFLRGIAEMGIEFVEQPVAHDDLDGLRLCRTTGVSISVDESLNTSRDALALVKAEACDVFNIKVPKVGGLLLAKNIAAVGAAAGLPVVVGGRTTLEPSRAASRHFAVSTSVASGLAHEGPGPASQALSDDVVARRTTRDMVRDTGGFVRVEESPGLGILIDEQRLVRYTVP